VPDELDYSNSESVRTSQEADALYTEGMAHYRRREWREAKACFVRLKSTAPDRRGVDALLNEVDLFLQLEAMQPETKEVEPEESEVEVKEVRPEPRAPKMVPKHRAKRRRSPWAGLLIALALIMVVLVVLYATGMLDTLLGSQRQARVQVLVNQGRAAFNVGEYDRAVEVFGEALALAPNNEEVKTWYAKAQRNQQLGALYEQAETDVAAGRWDDALAKLARILEIEPTYRDASTKIDLIRNQQDLEARFLEAKSLFDQGNWTEAARAAEQIREQAPNFRTNDVEELLFYAYFRDGVELMAAAGDSLDVTGQAIQSFDRALAIMPADKTALEERRLADLYRQGYLFSNQQNWPQAVVALRHIYDSRADYMDGRVASMLCTSYLKLGDAYYSAGNLEEALLQYRNVLAVESCDHVDAAVKEREVYAALYPPTATPTTTPTPTRTPRPAPTRTPTHTKAPPTAPPPTAPPAPTSPPPPTETKVPR
jgi:tetratricopeptide (TPR) repeat protein